MGKTRTEFNPEKDIPGEGASHPAFSGSVWLRGDTESDKAASDRFDSVMEQMGFIFVKKRGRRKP